MDCTFCSRGVGQQPQRDYNSWQETTPVASRRKTKSSKDKRSVTPKARTKIRTRIFCSTRIGSTLERQDFSVMTPSVQTGNATLAAKSPAEQKLNRLVAALEKQESGSSADCGPNHSKACLVQNHARCCCEARPSEEEATASLRQPDKTIRTNGASASRSRSNGENPLQKTSASRTAS